MVNVNTVRGIIVVIKKGLSLNTAIDRIHSACSEMKDGSEYKTLMAFAEANVRTNEEMAAFIEQLLMPCIESFNEKARISRDESIDSVYEQERNHSAFDVYGGN